MAFYFFSNNNFYFAIPKQSCTSTMLKKTAFRLSLNFNKKDFWLEEFNNYYIFHDDDKFNVLYYLLYFNYCIYYDDKFSLYVVVLENKSARDNAVSR